MYLLGLGILGGMLIGGLIVWFVKMQASAGWSNMEFDGTIFLIGLVASFLLTIVLTYLNPEFAALSTTEKIIDIIDRMFVFMAGFLFKKGVDALTGVGTRKQGDGS